jgi:MinD-like ATPase involved in chromosome partitioning or flagellar assembly
MDNNSSLDNKINRYINSFNIILADKDLETFERIRKLNNKFNFINLSSDFAVNFILEYEKIDLIIISKKISNLQNIIEKANRKKISVYILGRDIKLPINEEEIENILLKEIKNKIISRESRRFNIKKYISYFLNLGRAKELTLQSNNRPGGRIKDRSKEENNKYDYKCKKRLSSKVIDREDLFKGSKKSNDDKEDNNSRFHKKNSDMEFEKKIISVQKDDLEIKNIKTIKQKIIILSKAKGGVGSTTISIFLGYMFDRVKTLLVDLNFSEGGGDISYYLDIPRAPNILNFIDGYNRNSLENSVIRIKNNLDILQAPPTYEMSRKVDLQDIYCLADIAKKKYHLIIFDLPNRFDDLVLGVIDLADLLIMVSDHTLGSIGRLIKMNNRFIYNDLEKILIVNKYSKANGLNLFENQIEQFFNLKDFLFLDESEMLRGKSEFSDFDFNNLKSFNCLTEKVFDLLTCD